MKTEKEREDEKLLKMLKGSSIIKKIKAEEAGAIRVRRSAANANLEKIQKDAITSVQKLMDAVTDAETELKFLEDQKMELRISHGTAMIALREKRNRISEDTRREELILSETCAPAIDGAIQYFQERFYENNRGENVRLSSRQARVNPYNGRITTRTTSNMEAIVGVGEYCQNAMEELNKMKFEVDFDPDKIEKLKNGMPSINEYEEWESDSRLVNSAYDSLVDG